MFLYRTFVSIEILTFSQNQLNENHHHRQQYHQSGTTIISPRGHWTNFIFVFLFLLVITTVPLAGIDNQIGIEYHFDDPKDFIV